MFTYPISPDSVFSYIGSVDPTNPKGVDFGVVEHQVSSGEYRGNGVIEVGEPLAVRYRDTGRILTHQIPVSTAQNELHMRTIGVGTSIDQLKIFAEQLRTAKYHVFELATTLTPRVRPGGDDDASLDRALWLIRSARMRGETIDEALITDVLYAPMRVWVIGSDFPYLRSFIFEIQSILDSTELSLSQQQEAFRNAYREYSTTVLEENAKSEFRRAGGILATLLTVAVGAFLWWRFKGRTPRIPPGPIAAPRPPATVTHIYPKAE